MTLTFIIASALLFASPLPESDAAILAAISRQDGAN